MLVRIIENTVGETWMSVRRHLNRLQIGIFHGPAGRFRQRTEPTKVQHDLLAKLGITPPQQIIELGLAPVR